MTHPELSIVIPVYREQIAIRSCLEYLATCPGIDRCEVIVVDGDNGSTSTPEGVVPVQICESEPGRGRQLNRGAQLAGAPALLFLHVDTFPPRNFVRLILSALEEHPAGAFDLHIASRHPLTALISVVGRIRSRVTRVPYGDQAQFIRRDVFAEIGGFPNEPIMEDVALMDRLKAAGKEITFLTPPARTSDRRWRAEGRLRGTLRNWRLMMDYRRGVPPEQLVERYPPRPDSPDTSAAPCRLPRGCRVILFYRALRPGGVKTRLADDLGPADALSVYRAILCDSLESLMPLSRRVVPFVDDPGAGEDPVAILARARWKGAPPRPQSGSTLEERMENAFREVFGGGARSAILIGSDIPGLGREQILEAAAVLRKRDAVFGPSVNGGYYLIGFTRESFRPLLTATGDKEDPGIALVTALRKKGMKFGRTRPMRDVDTRADLEAVARSRQGEHPALDREISRLLR